MGCSRYYIVCVRGPVKSGWLDWFGGLSAQALPVCSLLMGLLPDQSALMGVLDAIHNLGLTLVSVNSVEMNLAKREGLPQGTEQ